MLHDTMGWSTLFANFLREGFDVLSLPAECDIVANLDESSITCSEIVDTVTKYWERDAFLTRLQRIHPIQRQHPQEFDDQIWEVMAEGAAFSWAAQMLGQPAFTDDMGVPDIEVRTMRLWIEVKRIGNSLPECSRKRQALDLANRGMLLLRVDKLVAAHPTFLKKFNDGLTDALKKTRPNGDRLVVYFELASLDFPTSARQALAVVEEWTRTAAAKSDCDIVVFRGGGALVAEAWPR